MKPGWLYMLAVVVLLLVAYGAHIVAPIPQTQAAQSDPARSQTTESGLYVVAIEPEVSEIRQGELHNWIVTVKAADGQPVDDAAIEVDGGMPEHNHGLPTAPEVTENLGEGRYRVEGMKFSMGGLWELYFEISAAAGTDKATFKLVL